MSGLTGHFSGTVWTVHVVLINPQIAPNTGNIIRLCANTGYGLHLIKPLGFALDDALLRRAGLDYHEHARMTVHQTIQDARRELRGRWLAFSSGANRRYTDVTYRDDDVLVFGSERSGIPSELMQQFENDNQITIPLRPQNRSLNLANAVAVVVYESWRQSDFAGSVAPRARKTGLTSETPGSPPFDP